MKHVADKQQAILDAALKLISENGFHGTAMSKVAQEAEVSTGIIYHYFESKDEMIDELYTSIKRNTAKALVADLDQTQPVKHQIRQVLGSAIRNAIRCPQESAFLEQYTRSPYYSAEIDAKVGEYYQPITACFERARQEMIIKDLPPAVITTLTLDVAMSLSQKQSAGLLILSNKLIEQVVDASWEAIRH